MAAARPVGPPPMMIICGRRSDCCAWPRRESTQFTFSRSYMIYLNEVRRIKSKKAVVRGYVPLDIAPTLNVDDEYRNQVGYQLIAGVKCMQAPS
jgi:hypothetical protein